MSGQSKIAGVGDNPSASLTPGQQLAAARKKQALSIEDVVRHTKLSPRQVMALEADAYDKLPGPVFVRGFMRNYARHLRLDPEPLLAALEANSPPTAIAASERSEAIENQSTSTTSEPGEVAPPPEQTDSVESRQCSEPGDEPTRSRIAETTAARAALEAPQGGEAERVLQHAAEPAPETKTLEIVAAAEPGTPEYSSAPPSATDPAPDGERGGKAKTNDAADTDTSGAVDTHAAWRNYALVSLAVVIALLALVIFTQT